jgi:hypothetical protein
MKNKFLKVNLQLFAENLEGDGDREGVVDSQTNNVDSDLSESYMEKEEYDDLDSEDDEEEDDSDEDLDDESEDEELGVANQTSKKQSSEENAQFKKMRLRAEREAMQKLETERQAIQKERLAIQEQIAERKVYDTHVTPQKITDYAYEHGVDESIAKKLLEADAQTLINAERQRVRDNFEKRQQQKKELQTRKYFKLVEKDVDEIAAKNPDVDYKTIYNHVVGDRIEELEKKVSKDVEKRTIANMQDRARRKNVTSDGGSDDNLTPTHVLTEEGLKMANAFGHDPREIAKYVRNQNKKKKRG